MTNPGTLQQPLRVAIIGAGPAGFYAADHLLKQKRNIEVDLYDRLPTPYGLVRAGVAPDHQKIKSVTKLFDRVAAKPELRFFGNVELGVDVSVADLRRFYHQIIYCVGAETDRNLNIPGIDLAGSHTATEFVAWYNGHPDYRDHQFDLSQEKVAVIGVGNVAVDVARILCRTHDELATTDIADYALEALQNAKVKEVIMVGRRGPAQAAFTLTEIKEMGEMADAEIVTLPAEMALDPNTEAFLAENPDRSVSRKLEVMNNYAHPPTEEKSKRITLRFLASPVELFGDEDGGLTSMKLVKNELYKSDNGSIRPRATDEHETIPVGLFFRSIGYRGVPIPDVPFRDDWGVIWNEEGRVVNPETKAHVVGEYAAGWIKRGPSGVIGTNKADAVETVTHMLADLDAGIYLTPEQATAEAAANFIAERKPTYFSYEDWLKLDEIETARGAEQNRPRVKMTSIAEMIAAVKS